MKPIDFYEHWSTHWGTRERSHLLHRERKTLRLLEPFKGKPLKLLDAGCGSGIFMQRIAQFYPSFKIVGVDFSPKEVAKVQARGFQAKQADFGKRLPFKDETFDLFYSGEVIEHLYNPDFFLQEAHRVLKRGGYALITTPNLCAWFNRILMPLGIQPLFLEPSTKSKLVGAGPLKRFKQDPHPVGHIRIFSYDALHDMFQAEGFEIVKVQGSNYDEGFPSWLLPFDTAFTPLPTLAAHFVFLIRKR
jgi:SAM-dependent methyltransferase